MPCEVSIRLAVGGRESRGDPGTGHARSRSVLRPGPEIPSLGAQAGHRELNTAGRGTAGVRRSAESRWPRRSQLPPRGEWANGGRGPLPPSIEGVRPRTSTRMGAGDTHLNRNGGRGPNPGRDGQEAGSARAGSAEAGPGATGFGWAPPYLRSRLAKISQACHKWRRSKSGQSVSRNTSSA